MIENDLTKPIFVFTKEMIAVVLIKSIKSVIVQHLKKKMNLMKVDFLMGISISSTASGFKPMGMHHELLFRAVDPIIFF